MLQIQSPLVSVEWLHEHLEAQNLIVLDATIPKVSGDVSYDSGELIPKSRFFDIKTKFSDVNAEFPNTLPSIKQFQDEARKLGVNRNSPIVAYDKHGIYSSARAWWLFKYFGHENVAVLDGGFPEWKECGFDIEQQYFIDFEEGNFFATEHKELMTNFEGIKEYSHDKDALIIDARAKKRFSGEVPEPRKGLRSGTIPNSKNLPYTDLLINKKFRSVSELKEIFEDVNFEQNHLVFSCGSGITACNLALAATLAGYDKLTVYDGSWTEYGSLTKSFLDTPNWSKDELIAYILLYASHSDLKEDNHERNVIISKVDMQTFQKIHDEFSNDNDFQSIQKILASIERHNYSKEKLEELLVDIKALFFADGDFDIREHLMLLFLKRILK
ncbi:MAG: sulfurtransferase [Winogradskyella sp.]|uniref:sulfurtransferase n=1 Tax=Winogradskyella sp. TaxID=1883156 RepID=UPI000F3F9585|nr:sulfurtransferase [Winogradskyella sp.]RNC86211.1 MAG: sulfurtransferase [Winogradskyella sp.]